MLKISTRVSIRSLKELHSHKPYALKPQKLPSKYRSLIVGIGLCGSETGSCKGSTRGRSKGFDQRDFKNTATATPPSPPPPAPAAAAPTTPPTPPTTTTTTITTTATTTGAGFRFFRANYSWFYNGSIITP